MTWYMLKAVDPETGDATPMTVEALTPANAAEKARAMGMVVTEIDRTVTAADDPHGPDKALPLSEATRTRRQSFAA